MMCVKWCLRGKFFGKVLFVMATFGVLLVLQGTVEIEETTKVTVNKVLDVETLYRNSKYPPHSNRAMKVHKHVRNEWILDGHTCRNNSDFFLTGVLLDGPQGTLPIYIHFPVEDQHISGGISREGAWEPRLVNYVHSILLNDSSLDFIDIGANIGVYTLTMAKLGRQVIAIEPFKPNIKRLCRTLEENRVNDKVTLITNPLSNNRSLVAMETHFGNVGGTNVRKSFSNDSEILQTITLDDVYKFKPLKRAVIKMDVESFETNVLLGAVNFFDKVDVPFMLMEWLLHKWKKDASKIIKFMTDRNMFPYTTDSPPVPLQLYLFNGWPNDIFWIKRGAFDIFEPNVF
ncbi:hypothetical protein LOTGIDRAFT_173853 [Lottia gigantea]|uniref:Methyltransferase FkbM domain-containing protein n=1 Tax=Lottia gigantea TaxID=225164 RepID=V4AZF8_LOTGI|nr:hypothetical protein LOTGIDRAFT_173853 [Lottia gigantea]ESO99111.1 hypothetical protein LOTGIDRAFT_173853 [Lottia gigantea]